METFVRNAQSVISAQGGEAMTVGPLAWPVNSTDAANKAYVDSVGFAIVGVDEPLEINSQILSIKSADVAAIPPEPLGIVNDQTQTWNGLKIFNNGIQIPPGGGPATVPNPPPNSNDTTIANTYYVNQMVAGVNYAPGNGWISGGLITHHPGSTKNIDVSAVVVRYTDYSNPRKPFVETEPGSNPPNYTMSFGPFSNVPVPPSVIAMGSPAISVWILDTGALDFRPYGTSVQDMYGKAIQLGAVGVNLLTSDVYAIANVKMPIAYNFDLAMIDMANYLSPFNLGPNQLKAFIPLPMAIDCVLPGGYIWELMVSVNSSPTSPNITTFPPVGYTPPAVLIGVWNDNVGNVHYESASPLLTSTQYNPGADSATLVNIDPTNWVNIPILYSPASTVFLFQYPTEEYATKNDALANIGKFTRLSSVRDARYFIILGYITLEQGVTDLSAAEFSKGEFFNYGVGGNIGAGGGSSGGGGSGAPYLQMNTAWVDPNYGSDVTGTIAHADLPCATYGNAASKLTAGLMLSTTNHAQAVIAAGFHPVSGVDLLPFVNLIGSGRDTAGYQADSPLPAHRMISADIAFSTTADGTCTLEDLGLIDNMGVSWDLTAIAGVVTSTFIVRRCAIGDSVTLKGRANGAGDTFVFEDCDFYGTVNVEGGNVYFRKCRFNGDMRAGPTTINMALFLIGCEFDSTLYIDNSAKGALVTSYYSVANCELNYSPDLTGATVILYTDRPSMMGNTPALHSGATVVYYDALTASDIVSGIFPTTVNGVTVVNTDSTTKLATTAFVHSLGGVPGGFPVLDAGSTIDISVINTTVNGPTIYQGMWNSTSYPAPSKNGYYWILSVDRTISGTLYHAGDWILYNAGSSPSGWTKVDNYDASFDPAVAGVMKSDGAGTVTALSLNASSVLANTSGAPSTTLTSLGYSAANNPNQLVLRDGSGNVAVNSISLGTPLSSLLKTNGSGLIVAASGGGTDFVTSIAATGVVTAPASSTSLTTSWGAWPGVSYSVLANTTSGSVPSALSYTDTATNGTIVYRNASTGNVSLTSLTLPSIISQLVRTNGSGVTSGLAYSTTASASSISQRDGSGNGTYNALTLGTPLSSLLKTNGSGVVVAASSGTDYLTGNGVTLTGVVTGTSSSGTINTSFANIASATVLGNLVGTNPGPVVAVSSVAVDTNSTIMARDSSGKSAVKSFQITGLASGLLKVDGSGNVQIAAAGGTDYLSNISLGSTGDITAGPITSNGTYVASIGNGKVTTTKIAANAVTYGTMQLVAGARKVLGNAGDSTAQTVAEIALDYTRASMIGGNVVQLDSNVNAYANQFVENFATTAVQNPVVNLVLNAASAKIQELTGGSSALTQTVTLPAQSTLVTGHKYQFINNSLSNLQISSNAADGAAVVTTLTAVSGRGELVCTGISSGTPHWGVLAYGATTTTALPLMTYPMAAPITTTPANMGNNTYLTALHLYSTMNGSNPGSSSYYTIYLPSFTHLMDGGVYSVDQNNGSLSVARAGGTWSGSYTAKGLTAILGYTPPIGFTFFSYISVFGSGGTLDILAEDTTCMRINNGSGGKWTDVPNPYVFMLVITITGANQYAALSNYSV